MGEYPLLCGHRVKGLWWFRVAGYGLCWKDTRKHPLLFSERVLGHGWRIGRWHFALLGR